MKYFWLMNQSNLSIDCLSVQKHFHSELTWKIKRYTTAGWWVPAAAKQATPMLCIPKKNGTLRTIFNLWQQNENTWKDITPFQDQDTIHHDIAQAKFRSKLDVTEAYEQMCIRTEDVCKTTFSTIFGTFQSWVMQMGDCNAPSTLQQVMIGWASCVPALRYSLPPMELRRTWWFACHVKENGAEGQ